jgi:ParB/RepB/Spo0J family partition protein
VTTALTAARQAPTAAMVPVDKIRFHPRNIRRELGDLRELIASIEAEGVLQPLLLHRTQFGPQVVDGHRRLAAARVIGLPRVPAIVVDELDDDEAIAKMLATTLRKSIDEDERRHAVRTLVEEFGHTQAGIARRLGVHRHTVDQWMASKAESERVKAAKRIAGKSRVAGSRITALVDSWQERASGGLSAEQAAELLAELRALVPGAPDTMERAS